MNGMNRREITDIIDIIFDPFPTRSHIIPWPGDDPPPKISQDRKGRKSYISKGIKTEGIEVAMSMQNSIDCVLREKGNPELVTP